MMRSAMEMRFWAAFLFASGATLLGGCAATGGASQAGGNAEQGYCQSNTCTGLCQDEVLQFAKNTLGSEAENIYFDWAEPSDGLSMSGGTVYFTTAACTSGKYSSSSSATPRPAAIHSTGACLTTWANCW